MEITQSDLKLEQWKPIPNSKYYEVSNLGRVRRKYQACVRILTPFHRWSNPLSHQIQRIL